MNTSIRSYFITIIATIFTLTILSSCNDSDKNSEIPLAEIPANIIEIVQNALPGISLEEAEKEIKDDEIIYELEGKLINGKKYEIEITATGTIIKIELED